MWLLGSANRRIALLLAVSTAGGAVVGVGPSEAAVELLPPPTRIDGVDRYAVAVESSSTGFRSADIVYVASGEKFADALSATSVAGHHGAPLLLTPAASLPANVAAEVTRLQPTTVVVVGGVASVGDAVVEALSEAAVGASVIRVGGADRYEVSRNLIGDPTVGIGQPYLMLVASGANFPDALTASPAASNEGTGVLLVDGSEPGPTIDELRVLDDHLVGAVAIIGGKNSVSESFEQELSAVLSVGRIGGSDRFEVGVHVNQSAFPSRTPTAYLASGLTFPDAVSGGTLAAHNRAPLYVVQQNCVPRAVLGDLERLRPSRIVLLGGVNTLGEGVAALRPC